MTDQKRGREAEGQRPDRDPEEVGWAAKRPQPETRPDHDPEEEGSAGRPER